ncbi:MAG: MATE family efflux transporter [Lachnospiraceae bacterium]|nr:MATE family efflux transporter [Lachnospiraceae bacterium]
MAKIIDMTKGNPAKQLLLFAVPIFAGNMLQQVYTLVDRIIVGRFVGAEAFSAIGATNALSLMFMSLCIGMAMGTGVVVSQYYGAKNEKNTAKAIANGAYRCAVAKYMADRIIKDEGMNISHSVGITN